jgi:hypothetical protein
MHTQLYRKSPGLLSGFHVSMLWKIRHEKKVESWHKSKERKPKRDFRAVVHVIDYESDYFLKYFLF